MSVRQGGKTIAGSVGLYPLTEKNITNCPTNIPQDIKLELNNSTLTLKAGSKVYVPNGAGVFDEVVIANDIVKNDWSSGSDILFLTVQNGSYIYGGSVSGSGSGTSTSTTSGLYYRTTENYIYANNNSSLPKQSLPIAIITVSNGTPFSIDEVFNGSGYIGSTMFALPGVKGLIPDGRNPDGSLKNIETEITNVQIISGGGSDQKNIIVGIRNDGTLWLNGNFKYLEQDNKNFDTSSGNTFDACPFCVYDNTSGKISKFTPKRIFHAVDYNEADFVVSFQRPTLANNYTWYRKYKSGWVEQGGRGVVGTGITYVTLPVQMANIAYTATGAISYSGALEGTLGFQFVKATNRLGIGARWNGLFNNGLAVDWQVSGMAA